MLIVTAKHDDPDDEGTELIAALNREHALDVTTVSMDTDHPFSDHRITLETTILNWLEKRNFRSAPNERAEETIMELERQWAKAEEAYDPKVLNDILADSFVSMDEAGKVRDKAQEIASDGEWQPPGPEVVDDMSVHLNGDTAICLGRFTWMDRSSGSVKVQGRFVDTFLRRNGRWQVVANSYIRTDGQAQ